MTRHLSLALGAEEPTFSQSIRQLEQAAGLPSTDIRLTTETMQAVRSKIAELGLDPKDTTSQELYKALHERIRRDEKIVERLLALGINASPADITARIGHFVQTLESPKHCFALKHSSAKRLLKKKIPKNAMKQLGYRSADSMLKHEPVAQIYAAALIAEGSAWHKAFDALYSKLQPSDFEARAISLLTPKSKKWEVLAASYVESARHNILTFKELGSVVMLPMPTKIDGLAIVMLLMVMHEMNNIRSFSSFAKLQQVKPDFGDIVRNAAKDKAEEAASLAGQKVSWQTIHRYYDKYRQAYHAEIFEPHVQPEDLRYRQAEEVLSQLAPALSFWKDTQYLVYLDTTSQAVSCNMLDIALSYCNHLSFKDRLTHYVRDNLRHELLMRYLNQKNLEEAVKKQLSHRLVDMLPLAE